MVMKQGNKILSFKKRVMKVIDRTQEEILRDRLQKRNSMVEKLRKKKGNNE
jgi:ppGpp synthetase/RelA/SpoT-type nucleotidyltranferase